MIRQLLVLALVILTAATCTALALGQTRRGADRAHEGDRYSIVEPVRGLHPTLLHRAIYRAAERCTGQRGDFARVRWVRVRAIIDWEERRSPVAASQWPDPPAGVVILTEGAEHRPRHILHELLHGFLLGRDPEHSEELVRAVETRCYGEMVSLWMGP